MAREPLEQQVDVEAHRRDHVDQVDRALDERAAARASGDADEELEAEPGVAHTLDVEEGVVGVRVGLVDDPVGPVAPGHRLVDDHRHPHVRVSLEAERQDRDADEEDGDDADYLESPSDIAQQFREIRASAQREHRIAREQTRSLFVFFCCVHSRGFSKYTDIFRLYGGDII